MKKVLILTYYWPPSGGAGVQRMLKFVKYFPYFGIEPIVITVDEKKASYQIFDYSLVNDINSATRIIKTSTFEPFEFYKLIGNRKEIPHSGFANDTNPSFFQKIMRFVRGNLFIPDARKGWNKYAYKIACNIIKNEKIDTIITSSPPHSTQLIGLKLKKKFNLKWISDIRDPWTDIYYYKQLYHTKLAKKIDSKYEQKVLENSDAIIVVSQSIKELFKQKTKKVIENNIYVIPNGYDEDDFFRKNEISSDEFLITYTGTYADIYIINGFLEAYKKFIFELTNPNVKLRFIGKISESLIKKVNELNISDFVEFKEYLPHKESVNQLLKSSLLLLIIPKIEKNEGILTGKLFEYLGSYKPILCIGPIEGNASDIIKYCNAGATFDYFDSINMFNYLMKIYFNQNITLPDIERINEFSRKILTKKVSDLINNLRHYLI